MNDGDAGTPARDDGRYSESGETFAVRLRADGREIPLKVFLHDLLGGSLVGLAEGLRGVDRPSVLEIEVRRV